MRWSKESSAWPRSSLASAASAAIAEAAASGSPEIARKRLSTSRCLGRARSPALSEACSRKRSAISPALRPPTAAMPAIASRSSTSALAPAWSALSSAASTPDLAIAPWPLLVEDGGERAARARARGAGAGARRPASERTQARCRKGRRRRAARRAGRRRPPRPPPSPGRKSPRRPPRRRCGHSFRALSGCAPRPAPARAGTPARDRNIAIAAGAWKRRDRRGRQGSYSRAAGTAPRRPRRRSETGGRECPRRTCRERPPPAAGAGGSVRSKPGAEEMIKRALARASRRRACRDRTGWASRIVLEFGGPSFNKAGQTAQPFSGWKVNAALVLRFRLPPWPGHGRMRSGARARITL